MSSYSAEELSFQATRSARFHVARRLTFDRLNRWSIAASVLSAIAVAVAAAGNNGTAAIWLGIATAAIGAIRLGCGFSDSARVHESLHRRYHELMAAMCRKPTPDAADLAEWGATIRQLYALSNRVGMKVGADGCLTPKAPPERIAGNVRSQR